MVVDGGRWWSRLASIWMNECPSLVLQFKALKCKYRQFHSLSFSVTFTLTVWMISSPQRQHFLYNPSIWQCVNKRSMWTKSSLTHCLFISPLLPPLAFGQVMVPVSIPGMLSIPTADSSFDIRRLNSQHRRGEVSKITHPDLLQRVFPPISRQAVGRGINLPDLGWAAD